MLDDNHRFRTVQRIVMDAVDLLIDDDGNYQSGDLVWASIGPIARMCSEMNDERRATLIATLRVIVNAIEANGAGGADSFKTLCNQLLDDAGLLAPEKIDA